jgi:ribonuclease BN (tRNA processing enzyme)
MEITVLGCGEAFDERYPNTSVLVRSEQATFLLDCGYSVPPQVWRHLTDPNQIDAVYISHGHADHYFGLPALLGRFWEDGRTKRLVILTQSALLEPIRGLMEAGYRQLAARFQYEIEYRSAEPGRTLELCGSRFDFAPTEHSVTNYALRIRNGGTFCYSGDGMFTKESMALFKSADLVVHEAYWFEASHVHADIDGLIAMADQQSVGRLALVHVQRTLRRDPARILTAMSRAGSTNVSLPEPLARYEI